MRVLGWKYFRKSLWIWWWKTPRHSESGQIEYLQQTFNSMNSFITSLVMSYVVLRLILLRMSWYKIIKPFRRNLKLVIKKYLCSLYEYFPGADSSYLIQQMYLIPSNWWNILRKCCNGCMPASVSNDYMYLKEN